MTIRRGRPLVATMASAAAGVGFGLPPLSVAVPRPPDLRRWSVRARGHRHHRPPARRVPRSVRRRSRPVDRHRSPVTTGCDSERSPVAVRGRPLDRLRTSARVRSRRAQACRASTCPRGARCRSTPLHRNDDDHRRVHTMCTELDDTAHHGSALDARGGRKVQITGHSTDWAPPAGRSPPVLNPPIRTYVRVRMPSRARCLSWWCAVSAGWWPAPTFGRCARDVHRLSRRPRCWRLDTRSCLCSRARVTRPSRRDISRVDRVDELLELGDGGKGSVARVGELDGEGPSVVRVVVDPDQAARLRGHRDGRAAVVLWDHWRAWSHPDRDGPLTPAGGIAGRNGGDAVGSDREVIVGEAERCQARLCEGCGRRGRTGRPAGALRVRQGSSWWGSAHC